MNPTFPRGPFWTPITPKTGSLFHADQQAPGDAGNGVGGCVDSLYGNATNPRPGGNGVLPSQSPGPFLNTGFNEPPRNDRTRVPSVGDVNKLLSDLLGPGVNVQDYCRTVGEFP